MKSCDGAESSLCGVSADSKHSLHKFHKQTSGRVKLGRPRHKNSAKPGQLRRLIPVCPQSVSQRRVITLNHQNVHTERVQIFSEYQIFTRRLSHQDLLTGAWGIGETGLDHRVLLVVSPSTDLQSTGQSEGGGFVLKRQHNYPLFMFVFIKKTVFYLCLPYECLEKDFKVSILFGSPTSFFM